MWDEQIQRFQILQAISAEGASFLLGGAGKRSYQPDEVLIHQGGDPQHIFLVEEGLLEVSVEQHDEEVTLVHIGPGGVFGEMGVLQQKAHSATITACQPSRCLLLSTDLLRRFEEQHAHDALILLRRLFAITADRLRRQSEEHVEWFRKKMEWLRQEQSRADLVHLLVHDMRSPLAVAKGGLATVFRRQDKEGQLPEKQLRTLRRISRNVTFCLQLVHEILVVGAAEAGLTEEPEWTTLREQLQTVIPQALENTGVWSVQEGDFPSRVEEAKAACEDRGLHLMADDELLNHPVEMACTRFAHVLLNILTNAFKYGGPPVDLRITQADGRLEVVVADRGPGIPEEYQQVIFERFRQGELKEQGLRRGHGMGLAGAKEMVESIGGSIGVAEREGGGTTFRFELPVGFNPP